MNTNDTGPAFAWPIPPFFQLAVVPDETRARACLVELINGRVIDADLASFEPDRARISLVTPEHEQLRRLDLKLVRVIRLTTPLRLIRDAAVMSNVGADEAQVAEEREFTVSFTDGTTLTGSTRGFLKATAGLFLYVLTAEEQVLRCFVPAQHLGDVQIGPLLGDALARRHQLSDEALAAALSKQAQLRQETLGQQLLDRGIVDQAALKRALKGQKLRPAMKLGELLVEAGLITPAQLAEALGVQASNRERRLGDILVEMGIVTVRLVQVALSDKLGIPFVDVRDFQIDPATLELLNAGAASRHQVLPLLRMGASLVVAVENPLAMDFEQELRFLTGLGIVPVIANPEELRLRIAAEYTSLLAPSVAEDEALQAGEFPGRRDLAQVNVEDLASELVRETSAPRDSGRETKERESAARVTDNALVRLVNKIIMDAHKQGASDIHIESNPGAASTRIRFRKDGEMEDYLKLQPAYRNALVSRLKIMAGLDISERRQAQDGKIAFGRFGPLPIELRVAIVPTANNLEDVVLRILGGVQPLPVENLGFSDHDLARLKQMIARGHGLILVCGPTGSGKTTTLHSILHHLNRPDIKIWTAEDPVEITQPGLRQVQVNPKIGWTFAAAMRAFLRADPDVIMVGEMRDAETAGIGIEASLTGHLVFSTLHTNSAAESIVRLLDLGMDPFNFADALIGVLSQRLARKLCPKCRRPHVASEAEIAELLAEYCEGSELHKPEVLALWREDFARRDQFVLYEAVGCNACRSGYKGRVGIYELLSATPQVKQLARSHGTLPQLVEAARAGGMRLLRQDAIDKLLSGQLDRASARAVSS
ncbi:MAG: type secretion system protein [Hydrocarboniphaga sp.]|uniref:GspE/PulE family protein n=1 Tax=Hydrocarboniphaga sp. TaxID=2033016 RepID=UPI0026347C55|nr:ATPase, T2SS/T4P/T4SS family [Hydrocarboniphaga sp.]MDB5972001.1 type secretion system protein [Hydrocarboniphaga sp.]